MTNRPAELEITQTPLGKEIVDLFAAGCLQYMLDNGIPLTADGFERLTQISRENKLNGRIAFQVYLWTQRRLQQLFSAIANVPVMPAVQEKMPSLRGKKSIRNRLLDLLSQDDENSKALLDAILERIGGDAKVVITALRSGDCQRDLVWTRMEEILKTGDPAEHIGRYREQHQLTEDV